MKKIVAVLLTALTMAPAIAGLVLSEDYDPMGGDPMCPEELFHQVD
jgi:hypothetical protein